MKAQALVINVIKNSDLHFTRSKLPDIILKHNIIDALKKDLVSNEMINALRYGGKGGSRLTVNSGCVIGNIVRDATINDVVYYSMVSASSYIKNNTDRSGQLNVPDKKLSLLTGIVVELNNKTTTTLPQNHHSNFKLMPNFNKLVESEKKSIGNDFENLRKHNFDDDDDDDDELVIQF